MLLGSPKHLKRSRNLEKFTVMRIFRRVFFFGIAEYNFGFVLHFTRFHWSNNAHVENQPIT